VPSSLVAAELADELVDELARPQSTHSHSPTSKLRMALMKKFRCTGEEKVSAMQCRQFGTLGPRYGSPWAWRAACSQCRLAPVLSFPCSELVAGGQSYLPRQWYYLFFMTGSFFNI
jgi:hypothetical protein